MEVNIASAALDLGGSLWEEEGGDAGWCGVSHRPHTESSYSDVKK